jgi:DNA repair exonuclease SbcCD nuclease subunit
LRRYRIGIRVKLLHFADLHLDTMFRWAPPEVARARRLGLRETLDRICALAAEHHVDALTCGGDLYEQDRFTPDTAEFLRARFAELHPVRVFLAPGNHDWCGPRSVYRQVDWSPNVHLFPTPRLEAVALTEGVTLWGAGHDVPANTPNLLESFRVDRGGLNIAVFHGSDLSSMPMQGESKVAHSPFRPEQIEEAGLDHALLGHFHSPASRPRYTYPGNPDPLAFGELGERGAVLMTLTADGSLTRDWLPVAVDLAQDRTVEVSGVRHSGEVIDRVIAEVDGLCGAVRVTLTGELDPNVDMNLRDIATRTSSQNLAVITRVGRLSVAYDFDLLRSESTVRGQFVRDVFDADLDEDERRRVLVTGLRALDGRSDLAVE